jgi:phosphatidylserine/phosphatidylglycerophosphate/cardiolipin synthase-like enzyme
VKLLTQPEDGTRPIIEAIEKARKTIEIMIFRFDLKDIEQALLKAVKRGVAVQALIACRSSGGKQRLRALEARLLDGGATVARTNDDLIRYHGKFLVIDGKKLLLLAFNYTHDDVARSRSFGIITTNEKLAAEAQKLFRADCARQPYTPACKTLLVSPLNARDGLTKLLRGAKQQILIYDPEISDREMVEILENRIKAGVEVRVIGGVKALRSDLPVRYCHPLRLHARLIVCDRTAVFLGSQSLRRLELDARREVGMVFRHPTLAARLVKAFESDWDSAKAAQLPADKVAKRVAKEVAERIAEVAPVVERLAGKKVPIDPENLELGVKEAVKTAVHEAIRDAVRD